MPLPRSILSDSTNVLKRKRSDDEILASVSNTSGCGNIDIDMRTIAAGDDKFENECSDLEEAVEVGEEEMELLFNYLIRKQDILEQANDR